MPALKDRELVQKICEDLLNDKITNYSDIQSLWQKHEIRNKFLEEILYSTAEFFVGRDIYREKEKFESSDEYLCVYVGYQLLNRIADLDKAQAVYKEILQKKNLTKEKVDKYITKI